MARKIVFEKRNGKVHVKVVNITARVLGSSVKNNQKGHGYIKIANVAIEDAIKWRAIQNIGHSKVKGENMYFMCNPVGYDGGFYHNRRVAPHNLTLVSTDIMNSKYRAYQIMDSNIFEINTLKEFGVRMDNSEGAKFTEGRHQCRVSYLNKFIQAPLILAQSLGMLNNMIGIESHHVYATWDMRIMWGSIYCLTSKQHELLHQQYGKHNHRLDVEINTVEELLALLDFVESDEYKYCF